jgi:hypothetical protein
MSDLIFGDKAHYPVFYALKPSGCRPSIAGRYACLDINPESWRQQTREANYPVIYAW